MPKQKPKMAEKLSNMAPNLVQVGAMLGSKIVLDASKGEKMHPRGHQKRGSEKVSKNLGLGRPPGGKYEGGWRVNLTLWGSTGGTCRGGNNLESRHLAPLQQDLKTRSLQASQETPSHQLKLLLNRRLDLEASLAQ